MAGDTGVRRFTLSCSRCRASKLKCDKKDPCTECVRRNVGHLCTKDERRPRAKRAKTNHNGGGSHIKTIPSHNLETQAEQTAQVLEQFVDGMPFMNGYSSTVLEPALSIIAPDYPNVYWVSTMTKTDEKLALIREIVDAVPEIDIIHLLYQVFATRCQGPLGNVVHTPTFMKQAEKFCACLDLVSPEAQVMALSTTVSIDTLACHLLALVLALAFHPTPSLLGWVSTPLTVRVEELRASDTYSKKWRSLALRCLQGEVSLFCGSIASLQASIMLLLDAQEGLLALDAILVTAISGARKLGLHRLGNSRLDVSESSTASEEEQSSPSTESSRIRRETGIRIWWALVMRDWSRAQAQDFYSIHPSQFNTRMPLHINDDDICQSTMKVNAYGQIDERPRSEFTMLSYTIHTLELAIFAREAVDLRGPLHQTRSEEREEEETNDDSKVRDNLINKFESFIAGLPSYFRLGSTLGLTSIGPMAAIPVHRWMLQQQIWSLFLRLHRASLWSQVGRTFCYLLAQNIISNQAQIQVRCAVCSSLSASKIQLFNAGMVLLVGLLFSSEHKDAGSTDAQLGRLMTRDKVREAIEFLQTQSDAKVSSSPQDPYLEGVKASAHRSAIVLEALMKLEESSSKIESLDTDSTGNFLGRRGINSDPNAKQSLKNKIMNVLDGLKENAKNTGITEQRASLDSFSPLDLTTPSPIATSGVKDLDILPALFYDPSCEIWQSLNFAYPLPLDDDIFLGTTELQALDDSVQFRPSSDISHSLSGPDTPALTDVYSSNTDGASTIQTPLSSLESVYTTVRL